MDPEHARAQLQSLAPPLVGLFGELQDAVYLVDAEQVQAINPAAASMLGYAQPAAVERELAPLLRELDARHRDTGEAVAMEALPSRACVHELLIRHRQTGEQRLLRCSVGPILREGEVIGAIAVASDITERAALEADAQRRAEFEQQLIGIVSHDLRNPLQVIRFSAAVGLKAAEGEARLVRQFERIISSSYRALRMIDDLLDFTRIRFAGGLTVERRLVDLHALAQRVVDEVLTTHPERSVEVQVSGDASGFWDPDRLEQVVQNLVGNALQHTTESTFVRVSTRGEEDEAVLEVHNGGPAIAEQDQARLFQPFQRGPGRGSGGRSMGLGLHIAAHIVHAHGGTLRLHSSPEHGTTFIVRLGRGREADTA